jgi:hypothetical protein
VSVRDRPHPARCRDDQPSADHRDDRRRCLRWRRRRRRSAGGRRGRRERWRRHRVVPADHPRDHGGGHPGRDDEGDDGADPSATTAAGSRSLTALHRGRLVEESLPAEALQLLLNDRVDVGGFVRHACQIRPRDESRPARPRDGVAEALGRLRLRRFGAAASVGPGLRHASFTIPDVPRTSAWHRGDRHGAGLCTRVRNVCGYPGSVRRETVSGRAAGSILGRSGQG